MKAIYPKLLVALQFGSFFIMAYFAKGFFSSPLAIGIFIIGAIFGLWATNLISTEYHSHSFTRFFLGEIKFLQD